MEDPAGEKGEGEAVDQVMVSFVELKDGNEEKVQDHLFKKVGMNPDGFGQGCVLLQGRLVVWEMADERRRGRSFISREKKKRKKRREEEEEKKKRKERKDKKKSHLRFPFAQSLWLSQWCHPPERCEDFSSVRPLSSSTQRNTKQVIQNKRQ